MSIRSDALVSQDIIDISSLAVFRQGTTPGPSPFNVARDLAPGPIRGCLFPAGWCRSNPQQGRSTAPSGRTGRQNYGDFRACCSASSRAMMDFSRFPSSLFFCR